MQFEPSTTLPSLSGYTMLLPCVSVGNVGQLAVDVVLATLQPTLVTQVQCCTLFCESSKYQFSHIRQFTLAYT
mgnify:CR=1 FL=1